jgi:spermidine synthase
MAAELTAVRLLAPHFGDSAYVWTNVIGIILGALAGGAWIGGRLAARGDAAAWPTRLLSIAGCMLAVAPFVSGRLGGWLLPLDLPLDAAMTAIVRGSFVATAVLFAPPMLLLGAVSPLLVTALVRAHVPVGRAAGGIGAVGTLGSLAGTFAATHWLVPEFGCRIALVLAAALLIGAGLVVAGSARGRAAAVLLGLLAAGSPLLHGAHLRAANPGRELLAERESRYQFLQVQRDLGPAGSRRTVLMVNEGLDSFHSLDIEGSALTGGAYYDWHAVAPLLCGDARRPEGLRALSIGDAAGSLRSVYAGVHPGAIVDGVDIDAACAELGERFFAGDKAPGERHVLDGRVFLTLAPRTWHVIHVDAYAHQVYVPAHLASREFFEQARRHLAAGGVIACNVGALHAGDPVLRAIGTTMAAVFGHALALPVPASRNFLVVARNGDPPAPAKLAEHRFGAEHLHAADMAQWQRIVSTAADPSTWVDVGGGGAQLLDDRPVLDRLLHASYVQLADDGEAVACSGEMDAPGAEAAAYAHRQARRWDAVLDAVRGSRVATAYLRELAGDARWSLRQLASAAVEYEQALALGPDAAAQDRLRQNLAAVREDLRPIREAEDVGTRNGWLAAGAALLLLSVLWAAAVRGR